MCLYDFLKNLRNKYNTFASRILVLLTVIAIIAYTEALERLDFVVYDVLSTLQEQSVDTDLVIVAIDEESIRELGGWPWSRGVHAELINRLHSINNTSAAFDLLFSELQINDPYGDQLLSQAIAAHGNIIFPVAPVSSDQYGSIELIKPHEAFPHNISLGHTDIELDSDGVTRRIFLHAGIGTPSWPALGYTLAIKSLDFDLSLLYPMQQKPVERGKSWVRSEEALIPFAGEPGSFPQIAYSRVLFDDSALESLRNKTVIIGTTAAGMGTRFATPASPSNRQPMSGVEWHANVYSMINHNRTIHPVSTPGVTLITLLWIGVILFGTYRTKKDPTISVLLLLLFATVLLAYLPLRFFHIWIAPGAAILGTLAVYPLWNWRRINQFLRGFLINKIRSSTALETIDDGVIITDADDHVVYINRGAENILKMQLSQATGKGLRQIVDILLNSDHLTGNNVSLNPQPGLDSPGILECRIKTKLGSKRNVRITRNQLFDEKRTLIGSVISMTDITDTVKLAQRVVYQEEYDSLTKLPNRAKLLSRFDQMIESMQDSSKTIAVLFVTLDNFKKINDAMGHQAGDKLLCMVSWRLLEISRHNEIIARWGGDEFILLVENSIDNQLATQIAQEIVDVIGQHFIIDEMKIFVSASIGISFYPQDGASSALVLEKAGTAMYQAKHKGGNRFDFYSEKSSIVWTKDRFELEKDLRAAISNNELQVFFQPIVDAESHYITRMEALVRWQHSKRGFLSPGDFVPLAENIGLIEQLGERVLSIACSSTNRLLRAGYPVKVSVNVNPRQFMNPGFLDMVFKVLQDTGLPSSALMLEITESAIVNNTERASEILQQIKAVGILIALDDFGMGYSSLTLLRELPIDILKIDKSFVRTLDQNQSDQKIVQAIIGLGKNLGLIIVAENVETEKQSQMLQQQGCQFQQGYFFSRPGAYEALLDLISKKNIAIKRSATH